MRIYLTGGTGYIGKVLAKRLVEEGHEVRALVRATSNAEPLKQLGVGTFAGDLTDRASMREGMSGADWVIHAGAEVTMTGSTDRMQGANVQGSENVASLAHKLGVGRLLSVSSMAWWGGSPDDGSLGNEDTPAYAPLPTEYSATKHAGEQVIQEWARKGLRVNTVFPSLVYGPPGKKEGANVILRNFIRRKMPALVAADRKTAWIYIDDLVEGILKVMEKAPVGRGYLMTGDVATLETLTRKVCALAGVKPPGLRLPIAAVSLGLTLSAPFYKLRGRKPPYSRDQLRSLARHWAFTDARAQAELDWHPRSLDEGLPPTVEFLQRA